MLVDAGPVEHFPHPAAQQTGSVPAGPEMGRPVLEGQASDIITYTQYVNGSIFSIPKSWSEKSTDDMLMTVYSFVKTFCASGAGQGSIDNRIEQAMDLVKSHLMSAVRSEVEELRDKIKSLEDTVQILSNENTVLRGAVGPDVLAQLTGPRSLLTLQGPAVLGTLPPPEPVQHPALQPPQH